MNQYFKYLIALILTAGSFLQARAQAVQVDAHLEKSTIPLGDQTTLHLSIRFNAKDSVSFPKLADSIRAKVQIVSVNKPDTSFDKNDITIETIDRSYTITSFDTGQYVIPQYELKTKTGVFKTPELVLTISPVAVDTTKGVYDIKQPIAVAYSWQEWLKDNSPKIAFPLLAVLVIAAVIWYLRKRPKKPVFVKPAEPEKPAHVIALDKLYALREQKLWQQDRIKEYHSQISDVMRHYLEKRYSISANEQTTDEILASLRYMDITEPERAMLKQVLVLSDLVKFAKEKPLAAENEHSINNAIDFVVKTQLKPAPTIIKEGESDGLV
ncbi:hypothetical protein BDD43_5202 [Mucilaginibacter gracilis]|uniref:Oxygen tolerance protein BatD n=1 Tax=Mucilaginibacter gracilis TaxID=423350 RepID=A0A495JA58_9SPHI|nr:hypothetical protein [Mucilaginibacter gracilis]RKR84949.1 hypothetical protein BDD43_5202 [Mucilaginibacter gracilis]